MSKILSRLFIDKPIARTYYRVHQSKNMTSCEGSDSRICISFKRAATDLLGYRGDLG